MISTTPFGLARILFIAVVFGISFFVYDTYVTPEMIVEMSQTHRYQGGILLALIMCLSTVIAPITTLPLVSMISPLLGPFFTGTMALIGWNVGSWIIFYIGRTYDTSSLAVRIEKTSLMKWLYRGGPEPHVLFITGLRMMIPVDLLSYALVLGTRVTFPTYALGTFLGTIWFSYAFAYGGVTLQNHSYSLFFGISTLTLILLYTLFQFYKK
jgi:uncharacterized membrane protein YdjX (TVP38/TMEM64 family)